jgi:hypothetical protein
MKYDVNHWHNQEFFGGVGGYARYFFAGGGSENVVEGRENGDLGAVAL